MNRVVWWRALAGPSALLPLPCLAHVPDGGGGTWALDPWVAAAITVGVWLYARGVRRLGGARRIGLPTVTAFAGAVGVLVLALLSPLDRWAEEYFYVHMIQHELLMLVAAPLLAAARPWRAVLLGLPRSMRRTAVSLAWRGGIVRLFRGIGTSLAAVVLQAAVLWCWHAPALFQAALEHTAVHRLQHISFLLAAVLFWRSLRAGRAALPAAVLALFVTAVHSSLLAALLTLSDRPWYAIAGPAAGSWLTALEDQQLGGLIMWVPGGVVYLAAALFHLHALLREHPASTLLRPGPGRVE